MNDDLRRKLRRITERMPHLTEIQRQAILAGLLTIPDDQLLAKYDEVMEIYFEACTIDLTAQSIIQELDSRKPANWNEAIEIAARRQEAEDLISQCRAVEAAFSDDPD